LWDFPTQITREENPETLEPYYVIMKLPETDAEEFMVIVPFTPVRKNNMVAWMAARCDGDNYGKLLVYEFSRQALLYGPRQIDSRIDQDTEISQQLTLWNQEGSEVFRGDLLVVPIEESLLYVEPVYLQARGQNDNSNAIPELKRVIVAYKDSIVMEKTLEDSLTKLFGQHQPVTPPDTSETSTITESSIAPEAASATNQEALIKSALEAYNQSQLALQTGDWQAYGTAQKRLGTILQQLTKLKE
ncbi:MAG: COG1615 family transporter, partial [Leptolyngbya sp. SIO3F4]|nr:COG1615 family transporter [Leptolyngbya sp. SIO3F4]